VALSLNLNDQAEQAYGMVVSGNYFSMLGVQPAVGRLFSEEEDRTPGAHPWRSSASAYGKAALAATLLSSAKAANKPSVSAVSLWRDADDVNGFPLSLMLWPMTAGSPPKRLFHKPKLMTATGCAPGVRSSSSLNKRPRPVCTPSIENSCPTLPSRKPAPLDHSD